MFRTSLSGGVYRASLSSSLNGQNYENKTPVPHSFRPSLPPGRICVRTGVRTRRRTNCRFVKFHLLVANQYVTGDFQSNGNHSHPFHLDGAKYLRWATANAA
jgi:hypothetical protein